MNLNFISDTPSHKQLHVRLLNDIKLGVYSERSRLPSRRNRSKNSQVPAVTVERAYRQLLKQGFIHYVKGNGYFVDAGMESKIKILLVFNKLSSYKREIYYSFLEVLGESAKVDLHIHHYDPKILEKIIAENLGRYNYYVIMPHFFNDTAKKEYMDKGSVYIVTSESELAELVKKARILKYVPGKDIGIISFNETVLKELLDITVLHQTGRLWELLPLN